MLRKFLGFALAATLSLATTMASWAADSASPILDRIAKSGQLRVGMSTAQAPFNFKNRQGDIVGMEVDLAELLAGTLDVELKIVPRPFAELLDALQDGDVDIVMSGMTATLERNMRAAFVGPYYISGKSMLTKSSTIAQAQQSDQINQSDIRLAALAGSTSQTFVELAMPKAKLVTTKDHDAAIQMLLDDKVDALVADAPVCAIAALRHPDAGFTSLEKPLTIEPIGIAVAPGDALLVNLLENYLSAAEATGILEGLSKKWFQSGAWLAQLP